MECPICCENKLIGAEVDWYPCPCGGQICLFCFDRIKQINGLCPYCRRPYDSDAQDRVGPEFRPTFEKKAEVEEKPQSSIVCLSKTMVEILGIPYRIFNASLLKRNDYLGQYGKIVRIACYAIDKNPFSKISKYCKQPNSFSSEPPPPGYVYVEFSNEEEAKTCILALNGSRVLDSSITACPALTEQCPKGSECNSANCMKLHGEINPEDFYTTLYSNESNDKIKPYLQIQKPPNYDFYPKRSFGISAFPPPRLIPPKRDGNANLIITSVGKPGEIPLINLSTNPGAIPMPSLPLQPIKTYERASLVDLLGLYRK